MALNRRYTAPFAAGGSNPIDAETCQRLLGVALERGGQYADLFFEYDAASSLRYEDGQTRSASRGVSLGLGVRVLKGDATGYAYTEDLSWESMARAARTASQIASGGGAPPLALSPRELPHRYDLLEQAIDVDGLAKRELLERASRSAHALDPRVQRVEGSYTDSLREIMIATSDGIFVHDIQPMMRFGLRVIVEANGKRESGGSGGGGRCSLAYFESKSPEYHAKRAVDQALSLLDAVEAPAGELPVVLAPGDSGILLHEAVGHGLEADFNRRGTSNYSNSMGKMVASKLCTVVDDPTLLQSRGSINVDDEGHEPKNNVLIQDGVLCGYLHDRISAKHFGVSATGSGRRESYASAPLPRMSNTILLGGESVPEEIIASVKRGIYAKSFGGGQVDITNGDFVFSLTESYLIEDGKLTAPLKGVNLIGNGPETLDRVVMLGNDMALSDGIWTCGKDGQSVPVGVGCPTIKLERITVGGTKLNG